MNQSKTISEDLLGNQKLKPQDELSNRYMSIYRENIPLEEKLVAIYTLAMSHLQDFSYVPEPPLPSGCECLYEAYKAMNQNDKESKSKAWVTLLENKTFREYVLNRDRIRLENNSNKHFLNEVSAKFREHDLHDFADRVDLKIREFNYGKA